jgi:hypothetical protein
MMALPLASLSARSRTARRLASAGLVAATIAVAGCASPVARKAGPSPAVSPVAEVPLPDYNSRLGSNRLAAEAGVALGRLLYQGGQYWEVYVRTTPPVLPGKYDPGHPQASAPAAALVTQVDVVMATESGAAIRVFGAGGDAHERAVLSELDAALRKAFPNLATDNMRVFYGESFQHGAAVFDHGKLSQYTTRALG